MSQSESNVLGFYLKRLKSEPDQFPFCAKVLLFGAFLFVFQVEGLLSSPLDALG